MVQPCPGKQTVSYISLKAFDAAIADLQMHLDALSTITKAAADAHRAGTVLNVAQAMSADAWNTITNNV